MKTWVLVCLITLQGILEHHIGPNIICAGKEGWLSLTDIPGLCRQKYTGEPCTSATVGPLLSQARPT